MSSLGNATKNLKFDKRLQEWHLTNGQMTKEELKKHIESLPDLASKVDMLNWGEEKPRSEAH